MGSKKSIGCLMSLLLALPVTICIMSMLRTEVFAEIPAGVPAAVDGDAIVKGPYNNIEIFINWQSSPGNPGDTDKYYSDWDTRNRYESVYLVKGADGKYYLCFRAYMQATGFMNVWGNIYEEAHHSRINTVVYIEEGTTPVYADIPFTRYGDEEGYHGNLYRNVWVNYLNTVNGSYFYDKRLCLGDTKPAYIWFAAYNWWRGSPFDSIQMLPENRYYLPFNHAPSTPGAFTQPDMSVKLQGGSAIDVTWGASTDIDGDSLRYELDFFDGNGWTAVRRLADNQTSTAYTYILPGGLNTSTARFRARAYDGQFFSAYATSGDFIVDSRAPDGSAAVNGGASFTSSLSVNLTLNASDNGGSGVGGMRFSNDGIVWSTWETYNIAKAWILDAGANRVKHAYVQFRDIAMNISPACSVSIIYNRKPSAHIISPANGVWLKKN